MIDFTKVPKGDDAHEYWSRQWCLYVDEGSAAQSDKLPNRRKKPRIGAQGCNWHTYAVTVREWLMAYRVALSGLPNYEPEEALTTDDGPSEKRDSSQNRKQRPKPPKALPKNMAIAPGQKWQSLNGVKPLRTGSALSGHEAEVLRLFEIDGLKQGDIAARFGVSDSAVRRACQRAREMKKEAV